MEADIKVDENEGIIEVYGIRYSIDGYFRMMADQKAMPDGSLFRVIERRDGVVVVETVQGVDS